MVIKVPKADILAWMSYQKAIIEDSELNIEQKYRLMKKATEN